MATKGLMQLESIILRERKTLEEYAAKQTANPKHVEIRDSFLQSLTKTYNLIYSELAPFSDLLFLDKWLIIDQQARGIMKNTRIDGIHIMIKFEDGSNYGLINL